jgi:biotin-[acetyl-CoA-carboxylase] ligase BirA-like protein
MIILSDDYNRVKDFLGNEFSEIKSENLPHSDLEKIQESVFSLKGFKSYISEEFNFWKYLLINDFAEASHFDMINDHIRKNLTIPDKTLLLAANGLGFHGFKDRAWKSEIGNIHLSFFFKPNQTVRYLHNGLLLLAANAVILTIDEIPGLKGKAKNKWVNDIYINNSKISGIITQSISVGEKIEGALIGIGLNVLRTPDVIPDRFTKMVTSISDQLADKCVETDFIFKALLKNLESTINLFQKDRYEELLKFYCERSAVIGKKVEIYSDELNRDNDLICSGRLLGINDDLELVIEGFSKSIRKGRLTIVQ